MTPNQPELYSIPYLKNLELLHAVYTTHSFARHTHDRYAIGVIEAGAMGFFYRGENVVAPAGCINLCIPGEVHNGHAEARDGWKYRMFYLDVELLQEVASEIGDRYARLPYFKSGVIRDDTLAQQLRCLHILLENQDGDRLEQESRLVEFLGKMILRYADDPPALAYAGRELRSVEKIKDYLQLHYPVNVSIAELSRLVNLSRFHLVRVFRQATGMPPHAYLRQVRLQRAKDLLGRGEPIALVAGATGFSDQSHLTRWFKKWWGFTPREYSNRVQYI